jgi:hypothetical protein
MFYYLFVVLLILLSWSGHAYTASYWVGKTGSDSRPCTQAQSQSTPKLSISSGLTCLSPGDTLMVMAGTYDESLMNNIPGGTSSARVTLKANPHDTVTIRGVAGQSHVIGFNNSGAAYITIDGFILDATNVKNEAVKINEGGNPNTSHHIRLSNNEIKNTPTGNGIIMGHPTNAGTGTFNESINNNIHHNGTGCPGIGYDGYCHGIYMASSDNVVDGGSIHDNNAHGMQSYADPSGNHGTPSRNIVRNVKIYNNGRTGLGIYWGSNNQVYNNVLYKNGGNGLRTSAQSSLISNNTIYGNSGTGMDCGNANGDTIRNNIIFSNAGNMVNCNGQTLSNNLTTNPNFVNVDEGNFQLQPNSEAINAGATVAEVKVDIAGISRPQGDRYCIGAYEFSRNTPPLPGALPSPANVRIIVP